MNQIHQWTFELVSDSPLRIGDQDTELLLDMDGQPFLPGTSWAGACRSYLENSNMSYLVVRLFGSSKGERKSSRLTFSDGYCITPQPFDFRTGVAIDGNTRTRDGKSLFHRLTVSAGVVFRVKLQLVTNKEDNDEDQEAVEHLLSAIHHGYIRLGAYKSTGGGKFIIRRGKYVHYDCSKHDELLAYVNLSKNRQKWKPKKIEQQNLFVSFTLKGKTASPLLIGGNYPHNSEQPDRIHIEVVRNGEYYPIIPGSSLKGVLRHQCERIANVVNMQDANFYIRQLFGTDKNNKEDEKQSSRVVLEDIVLTNVKKKEYFRIAINPLTGGVKDGALLSEETVMGEFETNFVYNLSKEEEGEAALALLLFALRDLGQQKVSIGSGQAIGRGYIEAESLIMKKGDQQVTFDFVNKEVSGDIEWLEQVQNAFQKQCSDQNLVV